MLKRVCGSIIDQEIQYGGSGVCNNRAVQVGGWAGKCSLETHPQRLGHPVQILKVQKGTVWGKLLGILPGDVLELCFSVNLDRESGHAGGMGQLLIQLQKSKGIQVAYDSDTLSYH